MILNKLLLTFIIGMGPFVWVFNLQTNGIEVHNNNQNNIKTGNVWFKGEI